MFIVAARARALVNVHGLFMQRCCGNATESHISFYARGKMLGSGWTPCQERLLWKRAICVVSAAECPCLTVSLGDNQGE